MLVVQRRVGERLVLAGGIEITVVATGRGGTRLAIRAPKDVWVARGEVHEAIARANQAAAATSASILEAEEENEMTNLEPAGARPRTEESR